MTKGGAKAYENALRKLKRPRDRLKVLMKLRGDLIDAESKFRVGAELLAGCKALVESEIEKTVAETEGRDGP
jgi:hypothetical protein